MSFSDFWFSYCQGKNFSPDIYNTKNRDQLEAAYNAGFKDARKPHVRAVNCYDRRGKLMFMFNTVTEAAKYFGINYTAFLRLLKSGKYTRLGYRFEYKNSDI